MNICVCHTLDIGDPDQYVWFVFFLSHSNKPNRMEELQFFNRNTLNTHMNVLLNLSVNRKKRILAPDTKNESKFLNSAVMWMENTDKKDEHMKSMKEVCEYKVTDCYKHSFCTLNGKCSVKLTTKQSVIDSSAQESSDATLALMILNAAVPNYFEYITGVLRAYIDLSKKTGNFSALWSVLKKTAKPEMMKGESASVDELTKKVTEMLKGESSSFDELTKKVTESTSFDELIIKVNDSFQQLIEKVNEMMQKDSALSLLYCVSAYFPWMIPFASQTIGGLTLENIIPYVLPYVITACMDDPVGNESINAIIHDHSFRRHLLFMYIDIELFPLLGQTKSQTPRAPDYIEKLLKSLTETNIMPKTYITVRMEDFENIGKVNAFSNPATISPFYRFSEYITSMMAEVPDVKLGDAFDISYKKLETYVENSAQGLQGGGRPYQCARSALIICTTAILIRELVRIAPHKYLPGRNALQLS